MPAKKKAPKMTRGERSAMVINRWATMESELDRLRRLVATTESDRMYVEKRLAEANELLKSGQETMREHVGVVVELNEKLSIAQMQADRHLRDIHDQVEARRKERAEAQAEIAYWMAEVNRLHEELIDIRREAARDGVS